MPHLPIRSRLSIGDWVKLSGGGFIIYGKVIEHQPDTQQVKIVTSTYVEGKPKSTGGQLNVVKIDSKEVPDRARLMILARISQKDEMEKQSKPPVSNLLPPGGSARSE